jgi:hypothetical protein
MDVFSMELGIRLSFVITSEFRGGFVTPPPRPPARPRYATGGSCRCLGLWQVNITSGQSKNNTVR